MDLRDAEVQLTAQRLRELMLWHGKDEGNLPAAATLVNLSRDTIAALAQLQRTRTQLAHMRAALAQLFWTCDSSDVRAAVLNALGEPCGSPEIIEDQPDSGWQATPNGLPLPTIAESRVQRASA